MGTTSPQIRRAIVPATATVPATPATPSARWFTISRQSYSLGSLLAMGDPAELSTVR
jgi:hypothetical protein